MKRLCITCAQPVEGRGNRCALHRRERAREVWPDGRPYDRKAYKIARRRVLGRLCECEGCGYCMHFDDNDRCQAIAEEADHIQPLSQGGNATAISNLRGMCRPCHIERHRREGS